MDWIVKRIQEDDYGCEERPENQGVTVLVTLTDENGQERLLRVEDDWLYANGIDEGDRWPVDLKHGDGPFVSTAKKCTGKTCTGKKHRAISNLEECCYNRNRLLL